MKRENPFYFKVILKRSDYCNRSAEYKELKAHALNGVNVVLFSPRRFGKTSIALLLQKDLEKDGVIAIYSDLYGVTSTQEVAKRLAEDFFTAIYKNKSLFKKAAEVISKIRPMISTDPVTGLPTISLDVVGNKTGKELLKYTLSGLDTFIKKSKNLVHIVIDEFQEITELEDSHYIEGLMRKYIQMQDGVSYFFVGSRQRVLSDMFNSRKRPFYKSAVHYELPPLPEKELMQFISKRFNSRGKKCSDKIAKRICEIVDCHPYYTQKLAYHTFECSGSIVGKKEVNNGFTALIKDESILFETMIQNLSAKQVALLKAVAKEPTKSIFNIAYIAKHNLGSIGAMQSASRKLLALDYIKKGADRYELVDPVFKLWLSTN